ncbi:hypothetical protein IAQ61_005986 [Plenodomus lingam]|uniref:uncharacterized protein n=1 Tax=Leptosphaeria maculans TaxID=5022 RepID=UPI003316E502|nr:hypothetical protein IAQ61_005986 [Plenodomus lingam]
MGLACQRCKYKKIKCDRGEPICRQCTIAKADCHYAERRKRPRLAQPKVAVHRLTHRLEALEKKLHSSNEGASPPLSSFLSSPSHVVRSEAARSEASRSTSLIPSPEASLTAADGQESWIYQLATKTKRNFENQTTPVTTPRPQIDNAISLLNDALEDLGKLRVRHGTADVELNLSVAETKACIEAFIQMSNYIVVPDVFALAIDVKFLMTLPDIIDSPYVSIKPGVRGMYYAALYFGLRHRYGPGDVLTSKAYLKILGTVPAWLDASTDSELDGHMAALITWTCINNHDYQLSWKFHCKACQFVKMRGIDELDTVPAKTLEGENERDVLRFLYWHVLCVDSLFRLFYGKPTVMRWSPNKVRPPAVLRTNNLQPSMWMTTITVVWIRYTNLTAETINWIDENAPHKDIDALSRRVDALCVQLEDIMKEWGYERLLNAPETTGDFRCLLADHIMTINAIIIGMQRIVMKEQPERTVDTMTVRAARNIIRIILEFHTDRSLQGTPQTIFDHFITFYPFTAAFSLYEYILACTHPQDCESDIQSLEAIGTAMTEASTNRHTISPFSNTINALNKVSRSLQDERYRQRRTHSGQQGGRQDCEVGLSLPPNSFDTFQNLMARDAQFNASVFESMPGLNGCVEGGFQPQGFVRALEHDFLGRNWRDGWWDVDGVAGAGAGLDVGVERGEIPGSQCGILLQFSLCYALVFKGRKEVKTADAETMQIHALYM